MFEWYIGKSRRERIASFLAFVAAGLAFFWAMVNDMSYGYEGAVAPDYQLNTNGKYDVLMVLEVFFAFILASVFFTLLFWCFRFLDTVTFLPRSQAMNAKIKVIVPETKQAYVLARLNLLGGVITSIESVAESRAAIGATLPKKNLDEFKTWLSDFTEGGSSMTENFT
jgi:hypothetical protein